MWKIKIVINSKDNDEDQVSNKPVFEHVSKVINKQWQTSAVNVTDDNDKQ